MCGDAVRQTEAVMFFDVRWEDLTRGSRVKTTYRNAGAGYGMERILRVSMADRRTSVAS